MLRSLVTREWGLRPDAPRRLGTVSAHEMLCHLGDAEEMVLRTRPRDQPLQRRLRSECPEFARSCETKGLRYANVMPSQNDPSSGMGRSWQSTLRASTREEAEQRLKALGYSWTWLADGCLRATTPVLLAVRKLADGRTSFFNQIIAAFQGWKDERNDPSNAIPFGDGTSLDGDAVAVAARISEELTDDLAWSQGDVALVANYVTMHGRRDFTGTRKVARLADCRGLSAD